VFVRDSRFSSQHRWRVFSNHSGAGVAFLARRILLVALGAGLATTLDVAPAQAFCRTRSCVPVECDGTSSPECIERQCAFDAQGCVSEGSATYYPLPCLTFAIDGNSAARVGVNHDQLLGVVERAFERWATVECPGGKNPGFEAASAGIVNTTGNFFCSSVPEANLGVWSFPETWNHASSSVGFTTLWLGDEARILDADVELSIDWLSGSGGELSEVLLTVATHEAGHVLGIDHSDDATALMAASYSDGLTSDRPLTPDDIAAICALYPPATTELVCPSAAVREEGLNAAACRRATQKPSDTGCSFTRRPPSPCAGIAALALLAALNQRRGSTKRTKVPITR
jgi:hypothetical protein